MPKLTFYQNDDSKGIVLKARSGIKSLLLGWGTGLGKTIGALVVVTELMEEIASETINFDHTLIVTPSETIIQQFINESKNTYTRIGGTEQKLCQLKEVSTTAELITALWNSSERSVIVATHQKFRLAQKEILEIYEGTNNTLFLVIDEGHHASESKTTILGSCDIELRATGNVTTLKVTATPFRADNAPVHTGPAETSFVRSLPSMMAMGFATEFLETEIKPSLNIDLQGISKPDKAQGTVHVKEEKCRELAIEVADIWAENDCMPVLIRFRASDCEVNRILADCLIAEFERRNAKVVNTYGDTGAEELRKQLDRESKAIGYDATGDVILACQRATEGMDSARRCLGICIGMPSSQPLLEQLIGRIMRSRYQFDLDELGYIKPGKRESKFKDYPEKWLQKSKQIFIIENSDEKGLNEKKLLLGIALMDGVNTATLIRKLLEGANATHLLNKRGTSEKVVELTDKDTLIGYRLIDVALQHFKTIIDEEFSYPIENLSHSQVLAIVNSYQKNSSWLVEYEGLEPDENGDPPLLSNQVLNKAMKLRQLLLAEESGNSSAIARSIEVVFHDDDGKDLLEVLDEICREFNLAAGSRLSHVEISTMAAKVDFAYSGGLASKDDFNHEYDLFIKEKDSCPSLNDKMPTVGRTFTTGHNFLKTIGYKGGMYEYAIERAGYGGNAWRKRLRDLSEVRAHSKNRKWRISNSTCPVKVYLEKLGWIAFVAKGGNISESWPLSWVCSNPPPSRGTK